MTRTVAADAALLVVTMASALGADNCHRNSPGEPPSDPSGDSTAEPAPQTPMEPRESDAWKRAKEGDEEDRMRLFVQIGCTQLQERAKSPMWRTVAVQSMSYCDDFSQLPWLADLAKTGNDAESTAALDAILEQAARPRRATDPEDAIELAEGCKILLSLARHAENPRSRRVKVVRALRMLAERGCVQPKDIPTDLDPPGP